MLITGVPGAGKTLVGLQFVHEVDEAIYLSGNGPLVNVLRDLLGQRFVHDVHGFLKQYASNNAPQEHIYVYDEAQRAWDQQKVQQRRPRGFSEPSDFIRIGERKEWAVMLGLIGQGQEIHLGEESGLMLWKEALEGGAKEWKVFCPEQLKALFGTPQVHEQLNLDVSLRTHLADDLQAWTEALLQGDIQTCQDLIKKVRGEGFSIHLKRDLPATKDHVKNLYAGTIDKHYGLIASSKGQVLRQFGVDNSFDATKSVNQVQYYTALPKSPNSCCQLNHVVTEFGCQGLELDYPIVCWDDDLIFKNGGWVDTYPNRKARDSFKLRLNAYRVLLTRGRDGMVIYIPPSEKLDSTFELIKQAVTPSS